MLPSGKAILLVINSLSLDKFHGLDFVGKFIPTTPCSSETPIENLGSGKEDVHGKNFQSCIDKVYSNNQIFRKSWCVIKVSKNIGITVSLSTNCCHDFLYFPGNFSPPHGNMP